MITVQNTIEDLHQELEAPYKEADRLLDSMEDSRIMGLCHDHFEVMFYDALDHTQYRIETNSEPDKPEMRRRGVANT